jgi:hypothetical protein
MEGAGTDNEKAAKGEAAGRAGRRTLAHKLARRDRPGEV